MKAAGKQRPQTKRKAADVAGAALKKSNESKPRQDNKNLTGQPRTGSLPERQPCEYSTCVFDHKGKPCYSNPAWPGELPHPVSNKQCDRLVVRRQAMAKLLGIPSVRVPQEV